MQDVEKLLDDTRAIAYRFLSSLPSRRVGASATADELRSRLRQPLTDEGVPADTVIRDLASGVDAGIVASAGPRYFGFVIGGSLPVALAADWLTSTWDQNCGIFVASPAASVVEEVAVEWLLELFGLPRTASVGFVTGCQMANFTALAAARHGVLRRAGWNVEERGLMGGPAINVVVSAEAHITIHTSLRMLGLGTSSVHRIATDREGRMDAGALRERLAQLKGPTIVCAQVGNVNTGSIDPVTDIIGAAHDQGAWVHIDGAFGLWGTTTARLRPLLKGVERADSWATDAHKWLNVPYDNGIVIVADPASHRASMTLQAEYLEQTAGTERDEIDWVPEFSRRGRGFTVYAALRHLGRNGLARLIERSCERARQMSQALGRDERVEALAPVVLNQVLVRFRGGKRPADEVTRGVIRRVQQEGTCWLAGTTWKGMAAMRVSVSNWSTSEEDIARSAAAILRCLDEELNQAY
jgi:glutamate/tyrosine decarboxylase-like PLP-dependent enzyme